MYYKSFGEILKEKEAFKLANTCSPELVKKLKRLGIEEEGIIELGQLLPNFIPSHYWKMVCNSTDSKVDKKAKMLIWSIEERIYIR